jgi:hypothetical protein
MLYHHRVAVTLLLGLAVFGTVLPREERILRA